MRVLIVDDSPEVADFLAESARIFHAEQVDKAGSGEEALAFATRTTYDLVTLDIRMPGVTGLDILSVIRSLCPHAVIAIISGYLADAAGSQNVEAYADLLLSKPVSLVKYRQLMELTDQLIQVRHRVRQLGDSSP
jgi:CheY-like chemotaxis protein